MIGVHLPLDLLSVLLCLAVKILIATAFTNTGHFFHPEVICIGPQSINGLLEADFYLEAVPIDPDDIQGIQ